MNLRRTPSRSDIPAASAPLESERDEMAKAFMQAMNVPKRPIEFDRTVEEGSDAIDGFIWQSQAVAENANWGSDESLNQELRDQTLKKSWLIDKFEAGRSIDMVTTIVSSTAVTDQFKNRVRSFLKRIPRSLRQVVRKYHTEILVVGNVSEVDPELALKPMLRHPDHEVVGNMPAFYEPRLNALVFAEKPDLSAREKERRGRFERTKTLFEQLGIRLPGKLSQRSYVSLSQCAAHEFGHALDRALGNFSANHQFDQAFQDDLGKIGQSDKSKLWHYTAPFATSGMNQMNYSAAKEELFAELFALNHGLGSVLTEIDELLLTNFPSTNQLIRSRIASAAEFV